MNLASGQNHETPPDQAGGRAGLTPDSPIKTWIFDLDNTLYPGGSRVWPQIDLRITLFLSNFFGLDGLSARALQKHYYYRYGTTLNGLMAEHGIDPHPISILPMTSISTRSPPILLWVWRLPLCRAAS